MKALAPAPVSTETSIFLATRRLTVSGTMATRVSPEALSLGTASLIGDLPESWWKGSGRGLSRRTSNRRPALRAHRYPCAPPASSSRPPSQVPSGGLTAEPLDELLASGIGVRFPTGH